MIVAVDLAALARRGDREGFDRLAARVESVATKLFQALPEDEASARMREIRERWPEGARPGADELGALGEYLQGGELAKLVALVRVAIDRIGRLRRYGDSGFEIALALRHVSNCSCERVEAPWLAVEAAAVVPSHKRALATDILAVIRSFESRAHPALIAALARGSSPQRRAFASLLARDRALDPREMVPWLADVALRTVAERALAGSIESVRGDLRALARAGVSQGTRDAAVRLLRKIEPDLDRRGNRPSNGVEAIEARLRIDPSDEESALVWADALMSAGDPRGKIVALSVALRGAGPEDAQHLSRQIATIRKRERSAVFGRSGDFPYKEIDHGRAAIVFMSDANHRVRARAPTIIERIERFAHEMTDVDRSIRDGCVGPFRLTWPGTKIVLPYTEGAHYADGKELVSSIAIDPASGRARVVLWFPCEDVRDPLFRTLLEAACERLGQVFTPSRFRRVAPAAHGKRMKGTFTQPVERCDAARRRAL